ncbi:MAG: phage tail protein [Tannerellaceae bacterium]|nr:phage tail protein [Tannerellaceae bacterium]
MSEYKQVTGNFLTQTGNDFPLDCDTLDMLQRNLFLSFVIGNVAGDKRILLGCEKENNDTRRKAGYVFIRTGLHPEGEVLYFEGGNISAGMYLYTEVTSISAQGSVYPQAYTTRYLKEGVGDISYKWADFKEAVSIPDLESRIEDQNTLINNMAATPLGMVEMWAGSQIPVNYALCDGTALRIDEYPDLYAKIGTAFNSGPDWQGSSLVTSSGYFRLPDLRGVLWLVMEVQIIQKLVVPVEK